MLSINADPTFDMEVKIPVPGKGCHPVNFTFKHLKKSDFEKLVDQSKEEADEKIVSKLVKDWDFQEEYTQSNLKKMLDSYPSAAYAIFESYIAEYARVREKN